MNGEQGSMVPMSELGSLDTDQFTNYCADLCERVLSDENFSWEDAADMMFGPEPAVTFTRWTHEQ